MKTSSQVEVYSPICTDKTGSKALAYLIVHSDGSYQHSECSMLRLSLADLEQAIIAAKLELARWSKQE